MFDFVITGAGFAGAVLARNLAENGHKVLVIEKKNHVGGHCFDYVDQHGVRIHKYGPHLFHTSNKQVFDFLSQYTDWTEYQHRVLAVIEGHKVPVPFNLNSLELLFPKGLAKVLEEKLVAQFGFGVKVPILKLRETDDSDLKLLADYIYENIFVYYSAKQWGCRPEDIDPEVTGRVPVYISRDNRYFQDTYQVVPTDGYTRLFENLLEHSNIHLLLQTEFKDVMSIDQNSGELSLFGKPYSGHLLYSGLIDELFDFRFGELPYRSLNFNHQHYDQEYFQEATTINYPNNYDFTRITEFKRIHESVAAGTTVVREYPMEYDRKKTEMNLPYYPVFQTESRKLYEQYEAYGMQFEHITFVGRLAEYRYYDMDDIVARALEVSDELIRKLS